MNRLPQSTQAQIVSALVEGNSIRATCRMTGTAKGTVIRLLREVGAASALHHDRTVRNVRARRVQCDEIWSFCHAKQRNVPKEKQDLGSYGDVWTWVALDADAKLVISWVVGKRTARCARDLMADLRDRVPGRIQLTTDGLPHYKDAVEFTFGGDVDFGQLMKQYEVDPRADARYSPPVCTGAIRHPVSGNPEWKAISTSFVERQNLTMRMGMRRFTRLTNAFSKKIENLEYALALHFMHYNFCRRHQTLKTTPAIAAGIADHVWGPFELVGLTGETLAA